MIRPATSDDMARVVELLQASRAAAGFDDPNGPTGFTFPFVRAKAERMFLFHLERQDSFCSVYDRAGVVQGVLLAVAFEHAFGPVILSKETMWWIEPAHRGGTAAVRMLDAYEAWAKALGCNYAGMAGMADDPRIDALYRRRSYRVVETHWLKVL